MRYKNIKTGAIIDSSLIIKGSNWQLVEEKKPEQKPVKKVNKPKE